MLSAFLLILLFLNGGDGYSMFCSNKYCEFKVGSPRSKLVLVAPHSGHLRPSSMPDRRQGCKVNGTCLYRHNCTGNSWVSWGWSCWVTTVNDINTNGLINAIADSYHNLTGMRPHVVVNYLDRQKVDMNRERAKATFHHPAAVLAHREFYRFIKIAKKHDRSSR